MSIWVKSGWTDHCRHVSERFCGHDGGGCDDDAGDEDDNDNGDNDDNADNDDEILTQGKS